jgi:hypothetical protein
VLPGTPNCAGPAPVSAAQVVGLAGQLSAMNCCQAKQLASFWLVSPAMSDGMVEVTVGDPKHPLLVP